MQTGLFQLPDPVYRGNAAHIPTISVPHTTGGDLDGTPAGEIHANLAPRPDAVVIQKDTPDAFAETKLHEVLAERDIHEIIAHYEHSL